MSRIPLARRLTLGPRSWVSPGPRLLVEAPYASIPESEELLAQLDAHGAAALARHCGDFVLAHLSRDREHVLLYRSRASTAPLYYRSGRHEVFFSTDQRSLTRPGTPLELLPESVAASLVLDSWDTSLAEVRGVRRLGAGEWIILDLHGRRTSGGAFPWSPRDRSGDSYEELTREIRTAVEQAVADHVRHARSPTLMLSGGIDSSAIAAAALPASPEMRLWSWRFDELPHLGHIVGPPADVAAHLGAVLTSEDLSHLLRPGGGLIDPLADSPVPSPAYLGIAAAVHGSSSTDMVLTGMFADHLFQESPLDPFLVLGWSSLNPFRSGFWPWELPAQHWRWLLRRQDDPATTVRRFPGRQSFAPWLRPLAVDAVIAARAAFEESVLASYDGPAPYAHLAVRSALESRSLTALTAVHRSHGAALASPYLNEPLIELALGLGRTHRAHRLRHRVMSKVALRSAFASDLPPRTVTRKLNGLEITIAQAFLARNAEAVCRELASPALADLGLVDPTLLVTAVREAAADAAQADAVFRTMCVEAWVRAQLGAPMHLTSGPTRSSPSPGNEDSSRASAQPAEATAKGDSATAPVLGRHVELRSFGEMHVLIDSESRKLIRLNSDAWQVLKAVLSHGCVDEAWLALAEATGLDQAAAAAAGDDLLRQLHDDGWLEQSEATR